jgi:hypothetical protein
MLARILSLVLTGTLALSAVAQDEGTVVAGPDNIREFAPEDHSVTVDADTVNLRKIFEDLGADAAVWYQHVMTLSNPFFEGRNPGTRGMALAEEYAEFWLKRADLKPAFPSEPGASGEFTSYRQPFELPGGVMTVTAAECRVGEEALVAGKDFNVLGVSASGEAAGPLVFVGYGIEKGENEYTSFGAEDDFAGSIAVLFRYEPLNEEGRSQWSSRRFSGHSSIVAKMMAVAERKPAAIIMVNPPGVKDGRIGLETAESSQFGHAMKVPVIQLSEEAADRILRRADPKGRSLLEWRRLADAGEVKSEKLKSDVTLSIDAAVTLGKVKTANIGGVLPGQGELADEWLIIGAHLDHVGYGYFGTGTTNRGQLHPGADDNASGTAALLILADRMADSYASRRGSDESMRSVLFLAFTAEESGLQGSRHYTKNPTLSTERVMAMINMDMVGRLRSDTLSVGGVGTAEGFEAILTPHFKRSGLTIATEPGGRGPSDHANFYGVGVPVLFAFTGMHPEYHKPGDVGWTVNPAGAVKVVSLIESIAMDLATRQERLVFKSTDTGPGQDRGYAPVRLGIQPGMGGDLQTGILIEGVSAGTSAADAGIQPGDILLTWNGEELSSMASLMQCLQRHKPGDVVKMTLNREGQQMTIDVTLKASSGRRPRPERSND